MRDDNNWWRGNEIGLRDRLARASEQKSELELQRLTDTMYLGDAALKLMEGTARRADIQRVMAEIVIRCEKELREKTVELLSLTDSRSDTAQTLHFECRVCAGILSHLNQLVRESEAAADQYNNQGELV